jgi:hypothetical protein
MSESPSVDKQPLLNYQKTQNLQKREENQRKIINQLNFFNGVLSEAEQTNDEQKFLTLSTDYNSYAFYAFYIDDK